MSRKAPSRPAKARKGFMGGVVAPEVQNASEGLLEPWGPTDIGEGYTDEADIGQQASGDQGPSDADLWKVLWTHGELDLLLHEGQKELHRLLRGTDRRKFILCCSRQYGKSWWLCVEALSQAYRVPGSYTRYAAKEAKLVRKVVVPHMRKLLETCPEDLRPHWNVQDGVLKFPNGSEIHIQGCDNGRAESLRGTGAHLCIVDEAGFIGDLDYLVHSILFPQLLTTGGRILMASTPPREADHPFRQYCLEAEADGAYFHRTIHDAPHIGPEEVAIHCESVGGEESPTWRREYLAEFLIDEENAVVPEFTKLEAHLVKEGPEIPSIERRYIHRYISMDVGYVDLTVALLAWYDFRQDMLWVVDEVVLSGANSAEIDRAVAEKEQEVWGDLPVYRRVADAPPLVLSEFRSHRPNLEAPWGMPRKDNKEAAINALRLDCQKRRIGISPKCKTLIYHLKAATWNPQRTQFRRSVDAGHYDAVDAMIYLVRALNRQLNPLPDSPLGESLSNMFRSTGPSPDPMLQLVTRRKRA